MSLLSLISISVNARWYQRWGGNHRAQHSSDATNHVLDIEQLHAVLLSAIFLPSIALQQQQQLFQTTKSLNPAVANQEKMKMIAVHIRTGGRNFDATGTVISSEDEALHIAATARCLLADGQDSSPTCKFNINACEAINSTAACPRARIFFASDDSKLKQDAVTWFGPCALVPTWEAKHSGTQFGGSDAHGFIQAMTEWWMMAQSDMLVHTGVSTFSSTASPAAFKQDLLAPHVRVSVLQVSDRTGPKRRPGDSMWSVEPFFEYSPDIARCITGKLHESKLSSFEQSYFTSEPAFSLSTALDWAPVTVPIVSSLLILSVLLYRQCCKRSRQW